MKQTLLRIMGFALLAGAIALVQTGCANRPASLNQTAVKPYPLNYCLVSGDKIGEMGKPMVTVYEGQEIKFCCPDCSPEFKKDPEKYMKKLAEEEAKARK